MLFEFIINAKIVARSIINQWYLKFIKKISNSIQIYIHEYFIKIFLLSDILLYRSKECPGCPSEEQLESKKEILAVTETSEEPCVSDRQNGSGNEGQAPPVNCTIINAFLPVLIRKNYREILFLFFHSPRFRETRNDG